MGDPLQGLNPEQRLAATTTEGPLLVLAGAGTGKTRVITVRIAHLLARGVPPGAVLAMTFTNKAAREMRERVGGLVERAKASEVFLGTFHSFCLHVLRRHGARAGLPGGFSICDASDQLAALRGALRELRIGEARIQPAALQGRISLLKNRLADPAAQLAQAGDELDQLVGRAWQKYDEHLKRSRLLDFDDLLLYTLRLLRNDEQVRGELEKQYRYLLVDEYQDTNRPQYEILRALAGRHRNLCVVGDDDQSIYGWRGADVSKILGFERDFPGATVVRLERNYRSSATILEAANLLIAHNPARHDKHLRTEAGTGAPLVGVRLEDEVAEADHVAREIRALVDQRQARLSDFAVLFRTGTQPRAFESQFRARGLPYVLIGGMSFFDRKEVRDVLAYLRLVSNPEDEVALLRVINTPPRGVGRTAVERVLEFAAEQGISAGAAFARAVPGVPQTAVSAVATFRALLAQAGALGAQRGLVGLVREVIEAVGYRAEVERLNPDPKERQTRLAALEEILNLAENHQRRQRGATLASFLQDLSLSAEDQSKDEEPGQREAVTLMTLHSAKGLEFPRVYLVGLEEGILPHARALAEDGIEEERRLMYVGITRAQRHLTVTCTAFRARAGQRMESVPSRFLFEMRGEPPPKGWRPWGDAEPQPKGGKKAAGQGKSGEKARRKGGAKSARVGRAPKRC